LNGYLRVRAINPITGSNTGQQLTFLLFVAASENLVFGAPTDVVVVEGTPKILMSEIQSVVEYQSGTIGATDQELIKVELIPETGNYPVVENLMGENIRSVRALIQKPSSVGAGYFATEENWYTVPHAVQWIPNDTFQCNDVEYFNYFGKMFLGTAGSINYKMIVDTTTIDGCSAYNCIPAITNAYSGKDGSLPVGEYNPTMNFCSSSYEVRVPYYFNELFIPAYLQGAPSNQQQDAFIWDTNDTVNFVFTGRLYRSAGPDTRLFFFRCQCAFQFAGLDIVGAMTRSTWTLQVGGSLELEELKKKRKLVLEELRRKKKTSKLGTVQGAYRKK